MTAAVGASVATTTAAGVRTAEAAIEAYERTAAAATAAIKRLFALSMKAFHISYYRADSNVD